MALTEQGLIIETQQEITDALDVRFRAEFSPSIDLSSGSVLGIIRTVYGEREANVQELIEAVNSSMDPDVAVGARLAALCALTGTQQEAASKSTVTLSLTGDPTTVVAVGTRVAVAVTGDVFVTLDEATLAALSAWTLSTAYVVGDKVTNNDNAYVCTDPGTSASSGGPTTTAEAITDGGVVWRFMGAGTATDETTSEAAETGPTVAASGTITDIVTPVSGLSGVINLLDADLGSDTETSEALRIRRVIELARPGSATHDAIRADLLDVDGVTAVGIFRNVSETTDGDGLPPGSIECLVQGGEDQDIWDQLFASVGDGIKTYGTEIGTVEDSAGNECEVAFSRPEEFEIWIVLHAIVDPETFPIDGVDQMKAAIVAWGDLIQAGRNVVASKISAAADPITGVLDIPAATLFIGTAPSPVASTTIPLDLRQLAKFDTSRITVTTEDGVP